ncbi:MAG: hypothetical protein SOZ62_03155 [Eubacteriales bacterium]|nr:hypothetical protein [Eubacteriales bacterium]
MFAKPEYPPPECRADLHLNICYALLGVKTHNFCVLSEFVVYCADDLVIKLKRDFDWFATIHFECLLGVFANILTQLNCDLRY